MSRPSISVIMPAYNAAHHMPRVLPPLISMLRDGAIDEVLVVDDGSTDQTPAVAAQLGATVLKNPQRGGPGAARNFAATQAVGEILWFVDADVVAWPDGAGRVAEAFSDPQVHAIFGSYDDDPADPAWLSRYKNLMHRYYHQRSEREVQTFWAGCGAVRKDAFLAVGGFDVVTYPRPSIEDIDLGYRMRAAGGRIVVLPELQGKHLKSWSLANAVHTDIFMRAIPWSRLLLGREGMTDSLNTGREERLRAVLAGIFLLTLVLGPWISGGWIAIVAVFAIVLAANWEFFCFMRKSGGALFALFATGYHQIYYVYAAAAFAWCVAERAMGARVA